MATQTQLSYDDICKIVWAFADMVRDKGRGTVEDYAKIVLPTCLVKRILDIQSEYVADNKARLTQYVEDGIYTKESALRDIGTAFPFYNVDVLLNPFTGHPGLLFVTWEDIVNYEDNPNGESRTVGSSLFVHPYITKAKTFVNLMFEVAESFNPFILHVFKVFEFENMVLHKKIVPYEDYSKTCRIELKPSFSMKAANNDIFSSMYMNLVSRFAEDSGKKGGEFFTPHALVKQAIVFLDLESIASEIMSGKRTILNIADPTSGSNTFLNVFYDMIREILGKIQGKPFQKDIFYFFGQELKDFQYCLGLMNMLFHGTSKFYNTGIDMVHQNSNTITNYSNGIGSKRGQMDIVVANPPYGLKDYGFSFAKANQNSDDRWKWGVPKASDGEMAFLMTIYDLLNQQGKAVIVLPLGTLFRDSARAFRENLIKEDVIEGVITLPEKMFLTTQIPVCLWVLNKNKKECDKNKIFFINASKDFKKVGKFNEWNHVRAQSNYLSRTEEIDHSGYVDIEKLAKNGYNLSVQRYFSKEEEQKVLDLASNAKEIKKLEDDIAKNKSIMDDVFSQIMKIEGIQLDE